MKIEMNEKGIFIDNEKIDDGDMRIVKRRNRTIEVLSGNSSGVTVNGREITGFWGGCFAFIIVTFTFLGLAALFAAPFAVLIGLGWLIARAFQ